jgi:hypothetical protein
MLAMERQSQFLELTGGVLQERDSSGGAISRLSGKMPSEPHLHRRLQQTIRQRLAKTQCLLEVSARERSNKPAACAETARARHAHVGPTNPYGEIIPEPAAVRVPDTVRHRPQFRRAPRAENERGLSCRDDNGRGAELMKLQD